MTTSTIFFFVLFLLFDFNLNLSIAEHFIPADNILLSCVSTTPTTLSEDHRTFFPIDSNPQIHLSSSNSFTLATSSRVFTSQSSYYLTIKSPGYHFLRFHFYPLPNTTTDLFHVSTSSGFVLLTDFTVGETPTIKEFVINVKTNKLVVTFTPARLNSVALVSALEIFSAPEDLVPETARLVKIDGEFSSFSGFSDMVMETVYRVNVGGELVTPVNDTLWRTWVPDTEFLLPTESGRPQARDVVFSGRVKYRKFGASREIAPDSVYRSARVLDGGVNGSDVSAKMRWAFKVDSGYKYLVRMHFCDIASLALNELYFHIYLNDLLAYENFDISDATGQLLASPYYVDFVADVDDSGVLKVEVVPSNWSKPMRVDAMLNGLEIWKINNTAGSLGGEVPVGLVRRSRESMGFGTFLRSITCGIAFLSLCMILFTLIFKLKQESCNKTTWTRLPTDASESKLGSGNVEIPGWCLVALHGNDH